MLLSTKSTSLALACLATTAAAAAVGTTSSVAYGPDTATGNSLGIWKSLATGLDSPAVGPINASSYEWWYFDVVSEDGLTSVVVVFYTAPKTGFLGGGPSNSILPATITVSTPGNELDGFYERMYATEAVVESKGNGASGQWIGTGYEFCGAPDLSSYEINLNSTSGLVNGSLKFDTLVPGRYPCGPVGQAGLDMAAFPGLGWVIAVNDAVGTVSLNVNGTDVNFTGLGYHDKNHGTASFQSTLLKSTWGHGRLGPYSITWALPIDEAGVVHSTGYVAEGNNVLSYGCNKTTATFIGDTILGKYQINIALNNGSTFSFLTNPLALIDGDTSSIEYQRYSGTITGGVVGGEQYTGGALFEHFDLSG